MRGTGLQRGHLSAIPHEYFFYLAMSFAGYVSFPRGEFDKRCDSFFLRVREQLTEDSSCPERCPSKVKWTPRFLSYRGAVDRVALAAGIELSVLNQQGDIVPRSCGFRTPLSNRQATPC